MNHAPHTSHVSRRFRGRDHGCRNMESGATVVHGVNGMSGCKTLRHPADFSPALRWAQRAGGEGVSVFWSWGFMFFNFFWAVRWRMPGLAALLLTLDMSVILTWMPMTRLATDLEIMQTLQALGVLQLFLTVTFNSWAAWLYAPRSPALAVGAQNALNDAVSRKDGRPSWLSKGPLLTPGLWAISNILFFAAYILLFSAAYALLGL